MLDAADFRSCAMIDRPALVASRTTSRLLAALGLALAVGAACRPAAPGTRSQDITATRSAGELVFASDDGQGARTPTYALTASDGTGLRLAVLEVRAVVQGPLAFTQLQLCRVTLST